jgi:uncharacterized membrane-anchored protein
MISLRLLGAVDVNDGDGRGFTELLRRPKRISVLADLAAANPRGSHRRDKLLGPFRAEVPQERARKAMNQALYVLRSELGKDAILTRGDDEVALKEGQFTVDVRASDDAIGTGDSEQAVEWYRGKFLEGLLLPFRVLHHRMPWRLHMTPIRRVAPVVLLALSYPVISQAQDRNVQFWDIPWKEGPTVGTLGAEATITVLENCLFTGEDGVEQFNELTENITNPNERGVVVCDQEWAVYFTYNDIGHVKDDERDALDADAILAALKQGNERANQERQRKGWPALTTEGWISPPHYDATTHNLTWATMIRSSDGEKTVNHSVRLLGRTGTMDVDLAVDPAGIAAALPTFNALLSGFEFAVGHRYAEWREGDRIAEYGLIGLIVGGGALAAVKTGLLARFWKLIVVAVAAGVGGLKVLFGKKKTA